jgi:hypothetical protein
MIKINALNCLLKFKAIWVELKLQINASSKKKKLKSIKINCKKLIQELNQIGNFKL